MNDDDAISVPRSLLASACYCVRKHAGTDSETYKQLSTFSLSRPTPASDKVAQADRDEGWAQRIATALDMLLRHFTVEGLHTTRLDLPFGAQRADVAEARAALADRQPDQRLRNEANVQLVRDLDRHANAIYSDFAQSDLWSTLVAARDTIAGNRQPDQRGGEVEHV